MKNNYKLSRLLLLIGSAILAGALFLPIWRIELDAPQYPEGLVLQIYASKIAGDVEIVNGLNHYIGMATLHTEDFIEFTLLPYIIASLVLLGFVAAFVNKKRGYTLYLLLFLFVAIVSMVDFYRWEYNYGHNLNPEAPIQVPGMAYQPPLIGFKQLLNFGAYSIPDTGGWIFIASGLLSLLAFAFAVKPKWLGFKASASKTAMLACGMMFFLSSCNVSPKAIRYGSDECAHCKMIIMDNKFGCELLNKNGKAYTFDDLQCLKSFLNREEAKNCTAFVTDYLAKEKTLVKAADMFFVKDENLKSPMGGNTAAFASKADAENYAKANAAQVTEWNASAELANR